MKIDNPPFFMKYFRNVFLSLPINNNTVYLTFDDGPDPEITPKVLAILKTFQAKATFFCVGDNVMKYPEVYQQIINEGHLTGNHTFNHINGWKTTTKAYLNNVNKASELINSHFFRPPYGKIRLIQMLAMRKKFKIILWSVLSRDFDNSLSCEDCYNKVINSAKPGSIITFHDSQKSQERLFYALPKILSYFKLQGWHVESLFPLSEKTA